MKKIILTSILALITNMLFAQFDSNLSQASWKVGKEKIIFGNTILRIEGKNDTGGMTNVGYIDLEQIKAGIIKDAEKRCGQKK